MTAEVAPAGKGHNEAPDYGKQIAARLEQDYRELANTVADEIAAASKLPETISDDDQMAATGSVIKRLRDLVGRIDAYHVAEKEPHLRAGQATDGFFFGLWERVAKRSKTGKLGMADVLAARIDDYAQRKLAIERARRLAEEERARKAAEELRRAEDEARRAADEERRKKDEAEAAAARARKPENVERLEDRAVEHAERADTLVQQAEIVRGHANVASDRLDEARLRTFAAPADMVRTRSDEGMMTMKQEPYVEIVDADKLDAVKLWPFIKTEHKLMALKAWARTTEHKNKMDGAIIEMRNRGAWR